MIVSVFDCDGTLYTNQFGYGMLEYVGKHGYPGRVRSYYLSLLPRFLLRKARLIAGESLMRPIIKNLGSLIAGWRVEEAERAFDWIAHSYLLPSQRPNVVSHLRDHQAAGHRVILLTGTFMPCLRMLGAHFGVDDLIGSRLELEDGKYTGAIVPPVITGRDKLPQLLEYCEARNLQVDWDASYAYADSDSDVEVLSQVGHATAVYPKAGLLAAARARGWDVILEQSA